MYREGQTQLIRFTLPADAFIFWREVVEQFPEWTDHVERLERSARDIGETNFDNWRCRVDPLPITSALIVEAKSYLSGRWTPIDASMRSHLVLRDIEDGRGRGVIIGDRAYLSARNAIPGLPIQYLPLGAVPLSQVQMAHALEA